MKINEGDETMYLGGKLSTTLLLEPGKNGPLMIVAGALVKQQPPGQLLAVELREKILVADVCQQLDHLFQGVLNGLITQLLCATLDSPRRASAIEFMPTAHQVTSAHALA